MPLTMFWWARLLQRKSERISGKSKPSRVVLTCILLESFIKFLVNPYYEPSIVVHDMNMKKWVVFASHWKSRKPLLMLLTMFCWTELLLKKVWEAFWANPCLSRGFGVHYIRLFRKFSAWSLSWTATMVYDMNSYEYGEMGSFCKSLKIEKLLLMFNKVLLNWSITKGLRGLAQQFWCVLY